MNDNTTPSGAFYRELLRSVPRKFNAKLWAESGISDRNPVDPGDHLYRLLEDVAFREGVTISFDYGMGADLKHQGNYNSFTREIRLNGYLPKAYRASVLCHELSHHFTPNLFDLNFLDGGRDAAEVIAESSAYVVQRRLGLDPGEFTTGYLAVYGNDLPLPELEPFVTNVADRLYDAIEKARTTSARAA